MNTIKKDTHTRCFKTQADAFTDMKIHNLKRMDSVCFDDIAKTSDVDKLHQFGPLEITVLAKDKGFKAHNTETNQTYLYLVGLHLVNRETSNTQSETEQQASQSLNLPDREDKPPVTTSDDDQEEDKPPATTSDNTRRKQLSNWLLPYIFPVKKNKNPDTQGKNWKTHKCQSINPNQRYAINLEKTGLTVVDDDSYKAQNKFKYKGFINDMKLRAGNNYICTTKSGGTHIYFNNPDKLGNKSYEQMDIKGSGGYLILWDDAIEMFSKHESLEDFKSDLADFKESDLPNKETAQSSDQSKTSKKEDYEFGPGKNNKAIASKASRAGLKQSPEDFGKGISDLVLNNRSRPNFENWIKTDLPAHAADYAKKFVEKAGESQKNQINYDEEEDKAEITTTTEPEMLIKPFFVKDKHNLVSGYMESGKTRMILFIVAQYIKNKGNSVKWGLFTTENDLESVINPILTILGVRDHFKWIKKEWLFRPQKGIKAQDELYLFNKKRLIEKFKLEGWIEDPLCRGFDYNKEIVCDKIYTGLDQIAKETGCTLISIRNRSGRQEESKLGYESKGNTTQHDIVRQCITGEKCHKNSYYAKEVSKEIILDISQKHKIKIFVLFVTKSSLFHINMTGYVLGMLPEDTKLNRPPLKNKEGNEKKRDPIKVKAGIPFKIFSTSDDKNLILLRASKKSGRAILSVVVDFLMKRPGKGASIDDILDHCEELGYNKESVRRKIDESKFEVITAGSAKYIYLEKQK